PRYSTDESVVPYAVQERDPTSLLNFYRNLIRFRNGSRALTYGDILPSGMQVSEVVSFKRVHQDEELLVLHNVSDVEITVALMEDNQSFGVVLFYSGDGQVGVERNEIRLPAYSTVILAKT
ncbi:MAG: DUF3459 domain-containing protein, partial [Bacteroidota bacterium]|nr:DUF3459 domain-containing protein [Bacteroidota bacterium]